MKEGEIHPPARIEWWMILPGPGIQAASLGIMRRWRFDGWGGKRPPASFCGNPAGPFVKGFFPADATGTHRPESPGHE